MAGVQPLVLDDGGGQGEGRLGVVGVHSVSQTEVPHAHVRRVDVALHSTGRMKFFNGGRAIDASASSAAYRPPVLGNIADHLVSVAFDSGSQRIAHHAAKHRTDAAIYRHVNSLRSQRAEGLCHQGEAGLPSSAALPSWLTRMWPILSSMIDERVA